MNLRKQGIEICENVFRRFHPSVNEIKKEICIFCNSSSKLTKEHVLPKWVFQKNTSSQFVSSVNRQSQTYNKTVIPSCAQCNNFILAHIENHMLQLAQLNGSYDENDLCDCIRWLELIDYKAQVVTESTRLS